MQKINLSITIFIESSRRDLLIDMVVQKIIFKPNHALVSFYLHTQNRYRTSQTGIVFCAIIIVVGTFIFQNTLIRLFSRLTFPKQVPAYLKHEVFFTLYKMLVLYFTN